MTKVSTFCKRHFQLHIPWRNLFVFDSNFTEIPSMGSIDNTGKSAMFQLMPWGRTSSSHQLDPRWSQQVSPNPEHYSGVKIIWSHLKSPASRLVLLSRLSRCRSKETSKFRITGLCERNPPVTDGFPSQRASNAENASIWWCHHGLPWPLLVDMVLYPTNDMHCSRFTVSYLIDPWEMRL